MAVKSFILQAHALFNSFTLNLISIEIGQWVCHCQFPWLISVNGLQEPSLRLKLKRVPEKFTNVNLV